MPIYDNFRSDRLPPVVREQVIKKTGTGIEEPDFPILVKAVGGGCRVFVALTALEWATTEADKSNNHLILHLEPKVGPANSQTERVTKLVK